MDSSHYYRQHWYWWGEAQYRTKGGKLELTSIPDRPVGDGPAGGARVLGRDRDPEPKERQGGPDPEGLRCHDGESGPALPLPLSAGWHQRLFPVLPPTPRVGQATRRGRPTRPHTAGAIGSSGSEPTPAGAARLRPCVAAGASLARKAGARTRPLSAPQGARPGDRPRAARSPARPRLCPDGRPLLAHDRHGLDRVHYPGGPPAASAPQGCASAPPHRCPASSSCSSRSTEPPGRARRRSIVGRLRGRRAEPSLLARGARLSVRISSISPILSMPMHMFTTRNPIGQGPSQAAFEPRRQAWQKGGSANPSRTRRDGRQSRSRHPAAGGRVRRDRHRGRLHGRHAGPADRQAGHRALLPRAGGARDARLRLPARASTSTWSRCRATRRRRGTSATATSRSGRTSRPCAGSPGSRARRSCWATWSTTTATTSRTRRARS